MSLQKQMDGFRPAMILRCEYFMADAAEAHKLQRLKAVGLRMSRTTFYDELWVARIHVAAWMRIPASVELPLTS